MVFQVTVLHCKAIMGQGNQGKWTLVLCWKDSFAVLKMFLYVFHVSRLWENRWDCCGLFWDKCWWTFYFCRQLKMWKDGAVHEGNFYSVISTNGDLQSENKIDLKRLQCKSNYRWQTPIACFMFYWLCVRVNRCDCQFKGESTCMLLHLVSFNP